MVNYLALVSPRILKLSAHIFLILLITLAFCNVSRAEGPITAVNSVEAMLGRIDAQDLLVTVSTAALNKYRSNTGQEPLEYLQQLGQLAGELVESAVEPVGTNGAWLWQPGLLAGNNDYKYANNSSVPTKPQCSDPNSSDPECNLSAGQVCGIGMDVSHFLSKWPIFLQILKDTSPARSNKQRYYNNLQKGILLQVFGSALAIDDSKLALTNFMDGTNGVYRWNYAKRGKNFGHNPFGLSDTLFRAGLVFGNHPLGAWLYSYLPTILHLYPGATERELLFSLVSQKYASASAPSDYEHNLFSSTIVPELISFSAWHNNNAYNKVVGVYNLLMQYAFEQQVYYWRDIFHIHFHFFTHSVIINKDPWPVSNRYNQLHYIMWAAQYLLLASNHNDNYLVPQGLQTYLEQELKKEFDNTKHYTGSWICRNFARCPKQIDNIVHFLNWKMDYYGSIKSAVLSCDFSN